MLRGDLRVPMLISSIADFQNSPYVIPRDALDACLQQLRAGKELQIVHSNLGNGKTIFAESLCVQATEIGWKCFKLDRERPRLPEELNYFVRTTDRTLLVIEHYPTHFDMLRELFAVKNPNISAIFTARTPAHEIFSDRLMEVTKQASIVEHDLNRLSDREIRNFDFFLRRSVMAPASARMNWSRPASRETKVSPRIASGTSWNHQLPAIRDRIQAAYDELCKNPDLELFVVSP